jgi:hypothetical protein
LLEQGIIEAWCVVVVVDEELDNPNTNLTLTQAERCQGLEQAIIDENSFAQVIQGGRCRSANAYY